MITRSKLVEQLRDYQIRSQHRCAHLTDSSPYPISLPGTHELLKFSKIIIACCSFFIDVGLCDILFPFPKMEASAQPS